LEKEKRWFSEPSRQQVRRQRNYKEEGGESLPERKNNMNKARRKRLAEALEMISQAKEILEEVKDEEQDAFDNLPENFQYGERGEQMEEYISNMEDALNSLEEAEGVVSDI
jgi:hypothetical protein